MATKNAINSADPIEVGKGGTGAATLTDHGVLVGSGTSAVTAVTVGSTGQLLVGASSADPAFGTSATGDFTFTSATAAQNRTLAVTNTDTTGANYSAAHVHVQTNSATTGDPYVRLDVSGGQDYAFGVDNSDADTLKITDDTNPSTGNELWTMTSGGVINTPKQTTFFAYNSANKTNVTGDGTVYTAAFDAELWDIGSGFDTGTFTYTAPATGKYYFACSVFMQDVDTSMNRFTLNIIATSNSMSFADNNGGNMFEQNSGGGNLAFGGTVIFDMTATDTVTVTIRLVGSTKTADFFGNPAGTNTRSFLCGYMLG